MNPCLDLRHTVQITELFKLLCRRTMCGTADVSRGIEVIGIFVP